MTKQEFAFIVVRLNTIWTPQWPMPPEQVAEYGDALMRYSAAAVNDALDQLRGEYERRPSIAAVRKLADRLRNTGPSSVLPIRRGAPVHPALGAPNRQREVASAGEPVADFLERVIGSKRESDSKTPALDMLKGKKQ